jgi:hypothetical protein
VPADTPFVLANLQAVPPAVTDAWLARAQPMLDEMQREMSAYRADLGDGPETGQGDEFERLALAVIEELDGKMNRAGFESLGLALESHYAAYGHGLFPVLRVTLSDPDALRAAIARIEADSFDIPEYELNGQAYWKIDDAETGLAAWFAIVDDHLAMGLAPAARENEYLPTLLAQSRPSKSVEDSGALVELVAQKAYTPYGAGYLDTAAVADELLNADSVTLAYLGEVADGEFAWDAGAMDPVCRQEFELMTRVVPRLVTGATELGADVVALRYEIELSPMLARALPRLVSDVPPASGSAEMASLSLALEVGRLREFLREKATAMAAAPFQCPMLSDVNEQARMASERLNQPMPPFIGNLKGVRAELDRVDPKNMTPEQVHGLLSLEMESPQMVIGMASMMIPGFEELNIEPGAEPVQVPQELMMVATPDFEVYAVMSNDAIGLSLGKGQKDRLLPFMEDDQDNDGTFLSLEYDARAIMELQRAGQREAMAEATRGLDDADPEQAAELQRMLDSTERMSEAYESMLGRARMEFRFTDSGVTIDQRQDFR